MGEPLRWVTTGALSRRQKCRHAPSARRCPASRSRQWCTRAEEQRVSLLPGVEVRARAIESSAGNLVAAVDHVVEQHAFALATDFGRRMTTSSLYSTRPSPSVGARRRSTIPAFARCSGSIFPWTIPVITCTGRRRRTACRHMRRRSSGPRVFDVPGLPILPEHSDRPQRHDQQSPTRQHGYLSFPHERAGKHPRPPFCRTT